MFSGSEVYVFQKKDHTPGHTTDVTKVLTSCNFGYDTINSCCRVTHKSSGAWRTLFPRTEVFKNSNPFCLCCSILKSGCHRRKLASMQLPE